MSNFTNRVIENEIQKRNKKIDHEISCRKLGFHGSVLSRLSAEVAANGFAGATKVPELVYLVFMTGMLGRPVSLVLKGTSGAGKSFSLTAGKQFIPEDAYEQLHILLCLH